jgi:hypothetical protein
MMRYYMIKTHIYMMKLSWRLENTYVLDHLMTIILWNQEGKSYDKSGDEMMPTQKLGRWDWI